MLQVCHGEGADHSTPHHQDPGSHFHLARCQNAKEGNGSQSDKLRIDFESFDPEVTQVPSAHISVMLFEEDMCHRGCSKTSILYKFYI